MPEHSPRIRWPNNRKFAFTIFDDTDNATVENTRPVYRLMQELGIRTTKSVWPLRSDPSDRFTGQSLQDPAYLDFIRELQDYGFEIGFHGARAGDNPRNVIIEALDLFREKIGHDPLTYAQHASSVENLYWGNRRTRIPIVSHLAARYSVRREFLGDTPGSEYFWGDVCQQRIRYVRNYGFLSDNVFRVDPWSPYHDPRKPYVNQWFSTVAWVCADRLDEAFNPERFARWERDGALVISVAHFAQNYCHAGTVIPALDRAMRMLAERDGWFAPVATILDYIREQRGEHILTGWQSVRSELRWAVHMGTKVMRDRRSAVARKSR